MTKHDDTPGKIGPLDYSSLAAMLKKLRETMNFRQEDLADRSPVTTRTIKRLEKGEKQVRPYHLEGICRALGFELRAEMHYTLVPIAPDSSPKQVQPSESDSD